MGQGRHRAGFALEARERAGIAGESVGDHLDRDFAAEPRVDRSPHVAHPARADLVDEAVVKKRLAGQDGHERDPTADPSSLLTLPGGEQGLTNSRAPAEPGIRRRVAPARECRP
jgi:hypothetical protein